MPSARHGCADTGRCSGRSAPQRSTTCRRWDRRRAVAVGADGRDPVRGRGAGTGRRRAAAAAGHGLRPGTAGQRRGHGAHDRGRPGRDGRGDRRRGGHAGGAPVHARGGAMRGRLPAGRPGAAARSGRDRTGALAGLRAGALDAGVRAVFAFPLRMGGIRLGVLDLYRDRRARCPTRSSPRRCRSRTPPRRSCCTCSPSIRMRGGPARRPSRGGGPRRGAPGHRDGLGAGGGPAGSGARPAAGPGLRGGQRRSASWPQDVLAGVVQFCERRPRADTTADLSVRRGAAAGGTDGRHDGR